MFYFCSVCQYYFFFFKQKTAYEMRISDLEFRRVLFRSNIPQTESTAFGRGKQERHHCHEQGRAKARLTHRLTTGTGRQYRSVPAVPQFLCLVTGRKLLLQFLRPRHLPPPTIHRLAEYHRKRAVYGPSVSLCVNIV